MPSLWLQYKGNKSIGKVKNGNLELKSTTNNSIRFFFAQIFINYKKDYSIETKIKQTSGKTNCGYGLCWGTLGSDNSYVFLITSSGYYTIGKYNRKNYYTVVDWTKNNAIKTKNLYNTLKIEKNGINLIFYINGVAVHTQKTMPFFGQMHGFVLQNNITCLVDYFKITNDLPKMEIADVSFKGIKQNIGVNINTSATELAPIISPDGQTLYFARGYSSTNPNGWTDEADIWYSERQEDGTWGPAKNIGKPLNNKGVNVVVNVMPDGNTLYLEGLYNSDGSFKSDQGISVTHRTSKGWSVPKQVKIDNFYNKNIYETYYFTPDQKVLIMSIERDDTYGDLDLYVSFRRPNGTYTEPKNMGAVLNTFADEGTPFMAPDGVTLFFSTSGLQGYGSDDIYVTKRLDDTWLHWSKPKNMGPKINTADWDTYLSVSARGDTAFLVSTANSYGNEDIFTIELSEKMQPDPVVLIYGKVLDDSTHRPIAATITYQDLSTGKEVGIAQSDPRTGDYQIVLPYGKFYAFRAEAKNYIAINQNIDLRQQSEYQEIKRNLFLTKAEVGKIIVLNNVFFKQASSQMYETSYPELDRIVKIMKDNPRMKIELRGHTDNRGNPQKLMKLSEDRVKVVKDYLVSKGIASNRITTKAFGGTKPINRNNSEAEHARNRRVEFKILQM
jgi:outer membrane protein OmpA-like peptidoglycan-associated protein